MISKVNTAGMSREAWLDERRNSIGGSEIGAILGLNKYMSPYSIWANKTGRLPDSEPNEAMRVGTDLEQYVAERFVEVSGLKVQRQNFIVRNDKFPHMHATIDRKIRGKKAGLECKTASALNASRFKGGDFPTQYYCQCVAYMAINEFTEYYLAALIMGRDFKVYHLTTDPDAVKPAFCESSVYVGPDEFDGIRRAAEVFWKYVEDDLEPPADGLEVTSEALAAVHAESHAEDVDLFPLSAGLDRLAEITAQMDELKKEKSTIENTVKEFLGDAETGSSDRWRVSWKTQTRSTLDRKKLEADLPDLDLSKYYKTTTTRVFKVKESK